MNTSSTTTLTETINTHHGQLRVTRHTGAMDIDKQEHAGAQNPTQPDVMDTPSENPAINDAHSKGMEFVKPSSISQGTQTDEWTPLLLSQTAPSIKGPDPTKDLLAVCGLSSLVASVARTDPVTGEKINKMRRSYEGKVKTFGLAGRNKSVKHEEGAPGGLIELLLWPDEEWQNQKVAGRELEKGLPSALMAKLEKTMKLEPGPVPKNDEWENILGHEKLKPGLPIAEQKTKQQSAQVPTKQSKANGQVNGIPMTVGTPSASEIARPKRSGRKRRYDEHSFEGYGEGFVDDDGDVIDPGGYSSAEGSRKSSVTKKKRKKDYNGGSQPTMPDRAGSYGVGMVGVGSGIGAYGR